ncbi:HAD-IIA family hydrolase [Solwaraspora sp. WMMD1047]|uniref:HAD-IIA family hydrolase n=1 Tax=Solwaraspora sp. WMMD1047 TaxID=3016102 RepID=UPI002417FB21|nr:HAD-IIA family hydrolase [Solwaraspora sp. WMMD1047]MDG4830521.1 HAD-IIA family hydrolase [Solwaraspora sp. WMMD1047]
MTEGGGGRLVDGYDLVQLDLDGVLYLIDRPIPVAVEVVRQLRAESRQLAFVTNNASRRSAEVAGLLSGMGVEAVADEVLTSAAAAAAELAGRLAADAPVLVVGADALREEIQAVGLRVVADAGSAPVAVVQGYGPGVGWSDLAEAAVAIRAGATWVATNADRTLPSPRGPLPGNGSLIAALRTALGRGPDLVIGKPEPGLFRTAAERSGAGRPLVVGDRLDTDIEGAVRAEMDSLLVLTGVSTVAELLTAPSTARPTYVAADLTGLVDPDAVIRLPGGPGSAGRDVDEPPGAGAGGESWSVTDSDAGLLLTGAGTALGAVRALCAAAWTGAHAGAERDRRNGSWIRPGSAPAGDALRALGLAD